MGNEERYSGNFKVKRNLDKEKTKICKLEKYVTKNFQAQKELELRTTKV